MQAGDIVRGDEANQQAAFRLVDTKGGRKALAALVALAEGSIGAGGSTETVNSIGYRQLTDTDLAAPHHMGDMPFGASRVVIESNAIQAVRWRDDGTDPTSTTGRRITRDRMLDYRGDLSKLVLIAEGNGAVLDLMFYE